MSRNGSSDPILVLQRGRSATPGSCQEMPGGILGNGGSGRTSADELKVVDQSRRTRLLDNSNDVSSSGGQLQLLRRPIPLGKRGSGDEKGCKKQDWG